MDSGGSDGLCLEAVVNSGYSLIVEAVIYFKGSGGWWRQWTTLTISGT